MKKNILYLMHVPWKWIKQRPHFFAEELSDDFNIDILCKYPLKVKRNSLMNKNNKNLNIKSYFQFPFDKLNFFRNKQFFSNLNKILFSLSLSKNQFRKYNYIWITSVSIYPIIAHLLSDNSFLIWDCMDDELEFNQIKNNVGTHEKYKEYEINLMKRSNVIICSSKYLSVKIQKRSNVFREINIINNGIELPTVSPEFQVDETVRKELELLNEIPNIFMYIGTISKWFDFKTLLIALKNNPEMNLVLIGPSDVPEVKHKRITYLGVKDRKWIFHYMNKATALIMPFEVNELIRSVNPVKIYEYIYSNKPILVPDYEEIDKFNEYVYKYDSSSEFSLIVGKIIKGEITNNKNEFQNREFISNNQWKNRYQLIRKILA